MRIGCLHDEIIGHHIFRRGNYWRSDIYLCDNSIAGIEGREETIGYRILGRITLELAYLDDGIIICDKMFGRRNTEDMIYLVEETIVESILLRGESDITHQI